MKEGFTPPDVVYDQLEGGVGEIPDGEVPGQILIPYNGLKSGDGFQAALQEERVGGVIDDLHRNGKHVGAHWRASEIIIFVARHPRAIIAGAAGVVAAGAAAAGTIHMIHRNRRNK